MATETNPPMRLLKDLLLFGEPISRKFYFIAGATLMLLKYAIEAGFIAAITGEFFTPIEFAIPSYTLRQPFFSKMPDWTSWGFILFSLPFLWIAVNLSVRRAMDACESPWLGLCILLPIINWFVICALSLLPTLDANAGDSDEPHVNADKTLPAKSLVAPGKESPIPATNGALEQETDASAVKAATIAIGYGTLLSLILTVLSVFLIKSYGAALFLGMPVIVGAIAAYKFNSRERRSVASTIGISIVTLFFALCGMLLFALEGAICLLMASPLLLPVAILGGILGYSLANAGRRPHKSVYGSILVLPLVMLIESQAIESRSVETYVVESSVIVDASADEIWETVIAFPEIAEPPGGYFNFGIAYPIRARIEGTGLGATRYCEFTTGSFVEPITVWSPPHHLGFDVTGQPDPMTELSPYRHVHPPHLEGSFKSVRGEFQLIELPDGRVRLEGRTWYQLDIGPVWYWRLITEKIVHDIHLHVLNHIKEECEK